MKSLTPTVKRKDEETLLKALAAQAPVGVCIMQDKKFCYVNPYFPMAIGYAANELIGKDSLDIVVPEDREMVNENTRRMLKGELLSPYQFRVICRDGSIVWVMATVRSIDYHGKQAILGSYMEVTERKETEEAIKQSEEKYRELANSITNAFFAMDEHLRYTYWNKGSEILTGIRTEDAIGKSLSEVFLDTPGLRRAEKVYRDVLKTRQPQTFVNDFDIDGRRYVFEISAYPSHGNISVLVRDITKHKQAEDALQAERNKLQSLIDSLEDTVTIQDTEYNIIYQSEPSRIASGGDHLGEKCYRAYEGRDKICDGCPVEGAFKDGKSHTAERKTELAGEVAFWENTASPIRDAEGRIVSCLEIARDVTKHKRQEQVLADELTRRRLLIDQSLDGIVVLDVDACVVEANQRFAEMLGYTLEEVHKLHTWDWDKNFPPEKILEMGRNADEKGFRLETKHTRKDGSVIDVDISINGATCASQKLIFCVSRDITERKKAEEALRESEERYRTILEEMEDAYFEVDLGGHLTFANNSVCRDLGYSREELIGLSYKAFTAEDDIDSVFRVFNQVYETGVPNKGFPWRTIRKDGVQGFAETSISPLRDNIGEIIGFRGVGRDITERKKTEKKLRQSEENYRTLFNSSVIGTVVLDAETARIVMVNQAAVKMFGFTSAEEVSKEEPSFFILPDDKERYMEITNPAAFEQNPHGGYQFKALTRDGREIWINTTAAKIMHEGRLAALISFTDITEQMRQRERLMMTDRMASLGELAAGTAHELNNPLTSIMGFSQLLMERKVPDDIREDVKIIYAEAQRAANVTKDLLTFARKQAPVKQLNQINSVIEDVLELRAYVHEMNGIEVKKHLAPDLPELMVDYFQMQQVFLNIIINAEYFMNEAHNGGTLTITTKKRNGAVVISIADDGPGIPPENLKRIFDPFFTTKEAGKGTGLGLSICHGIVTEHGGQIYVKSELGKGATVLVELPVKGPRPDSGLM